MTPTYHAIRPIFDRKTKTYTIEHLTGESTLIMLAHRGYYITDSLPAMLGYLVAGKNLWWNGLNPAKQDAVKLWLMSNI